MRLSEVRLLLLLILGLLQANNPVTGQCHLDICPRTSVPSGITLAESPWLAFRVIDLLFRAVVSTVICCNINKLTYLLIRVRIWLAYNGMFWG